MFESREEKDVEKLISLFRAYAYQEVSVRVYGFLCDRVPQFAFFL